MRLLKFEEYAHGGVTYFSLSIIPNEKGGNYLCARVYTIANNVLIRLEKQTFGYVRPTKTRETNFRICPPNEDSRNKISDMSAQRRLEKQTFGYVRPTKTQISMSISAVWSEASLSAWKTLYLWLTRMRPVKILIRLRECEGWSESSLGTHVRWYLFWPCYSSM